MENQHVSFVIDSLILQAWLAGAEELSYSDEEGSFKKTEYL